MSDPGAVAAGIVSQANPFNAIGPLLESATKAIVPYVGMLSAQTTELIVADPALAFYMTLMFMVSLIIIVLSDRIGLTRNLRYTALSAHLALLRVVRAIIFVGLFFVGRRIGQSGGSFESGYTAASGFIQTTTTTWFLQKIIEWFSAVGPTALDYTDPTVFDPVIDADSFLQTIMQVIYDYLSLYNNLVLNSLVGSGSSQSNAVSTLHPGIVTGDKSDGAIASGRVKTLFQLYGSVTGWAGATTGLLGSDVWYNSPFYAGLVVGMLG